MTILNAFVEKRRALVAVDSYMHAPDGRTLQSSKLSYLSHPGILVGCRGDMGYYLTLLTLLYGEQGDADRVAADMPLIAARALADYAFMMRAAEQVPAATHQEIVVVFWSPRAQRMRGLSVRNDAPDGAGAFASFNLCNDYGGVYISPWDESLRDLHPRPDTIDAMRSLASAQVQFIEGRAPGSTPGGMLIAAECERDGARIFSAAPLS